MGVIIQLNREQKLVLLEALRGGRIDYDVIERVKLRPADKYDHMSEEEYDAELKASILRTCLVETEYPDLVEKCCKARYDCGCGCYLSNYFCRVAPNRGVEDAIKAAFMQLWEKPGSGGAL